ncbi:MAG: hypothetical protein KTR13_10365 [Saprospiraceae bacterium]|nr:hypothetical protein [Saprospiraceae bacterium]
MRALPQHAGFSDFAPTQEIIFTRKVAAKRNHWSTTFAIIGSVLLMSLIINVGTSISPTNFWEIAGLTLATLACAFLVFYLSISKNTITLILNADSKELVVQERRKEKTYKIKGSRFHWSFIGSNSTHFDIVYKGSRIFNTDDRFYNLELLTEDDKRIILFHRSSVKQTQTIPFFIDRDHVASHRYVVHKAYSVVGGLPLLKAELELLAAQPNTSTT